MKKNFRFDRNRNKYIFDNRIFIDKDEFDQMSDDEIAKLIAIKTKPSDVYKKKENYVSFDEFKKGLDDVRAFIKRDDKEISFKNFLKNRYQFKA